MGAVFDVIDCVGLPDSTLVIATCDHVIAWTRVKWNLTDLGPGVMLILRALGPDSFRRGQSLR